MKFTTLSPILLATFFHLFTLSAALGVNYGTQGKNLPPPSKVANFIKTKTIFDSVKIFDVNPDILRAFANTNITVTIPVPDSDILTLMDPQAASRWVDANIRPFYPQTQIKYISVGGEDLYTISAQQTHNIIHVVENLDEALKDARIQSIKVATVHPLNIFEGDPRKPSKARFTTAYAEIFLPPLLSFHRRTASPFMIKPYPYSAYRAILDNLDFALFNNNPGVLDVFSGKTYTNALDVMLDKTFSAMSAMGYGDIDIVIGETGWPSLGDGGNQLATVENALSYNGNLVKKILSGKGTPLMPNRRFDTYIFELFNENQKEVVNEQYWGLFRPDFSPVYDAGVLRNGQL